MPVHRTMTPPFPQWVNVLTGMFRWSECSYYCRQGFDPTKRRLMGLLSWLHELNKCLMHVSETISVIHDWWIFLLDEGAISTWKVLWLLADRTACCDAVESVMYGEGWARLRAKRSYCSSNPLLNMCGCYQMMYVSFSLFILKWGFYCMAITTLKLMAKLRQVARRKRRCFHKLNFVKKNSSVHTCGH